MASRKDYYALLGVAKDAAQDEIKRAYRKLARKLHPDVNPGDTASEERFKEISEAYHVLGDAERRRQYDQVGPEAFAQEFDLSDFAQQFGGFFGGRGSAGGAHAAGGGGLSFLEDLLAGGGGFSAAGPAAPPSAGRDVQVRLEIPFREAVRGGERTVTYQGGDGQRHRTRVRVPAGVKRGSRIRVRGKGEPAPGNGPRGDLYLDLHVTPHAVLRRDGDDLRVEVPLAVYEAALGTTLEVPTLEGSSRINIPAGTRSGQTFRLRGRGVGAPGKETGDLLVKVTIQLPEKMDAELEALMQQIRDHHAYDPRKGPGDG